MRPTGRYRNCGRSSQDVGLSFAEGRTMGTLRTVDDLIEAVRQEAIRGDMPIDREVYEQVDRDPVQPILFAGSLDAPVCFFGRDLGKDEVRHGQPLIGAAGKLVRVGILRAHKGLGQGAKYSRTQLEKA